MKCAVILGWLATMLVIAIGPQSVEAILPLHKMPIGPRPPDHVVAAVDAPEPKLRETEWSKIIAEKFRAAGTPAETEFVCPDGSRVDVLTPEFAYEVEWAHKWKESIGQAVFYGIATNRQPGVILLMDREQTEYLRCAVVCGKLGIRLETRSVK